MKKLLSLCAILLFAISCSEDQPVKKEESPLDSFLSSSAFKELGIGLAELDLSNATIKEDGDIETKSVIIPYKGSLKYIISKGHVSNVKFLEFKSAFTFEYITNLNYEQLSKSLKNKNYTGDIEIKSNKNDLFQVTVVKGKFGKMTSMISKTSAGCFGTPGSDAWVQDVASCAADAIDSMNWVAYTFCIISIVQCWAENVIACIILGCQV